MEGTDAPSGLSGSPRRTGRVAVDHPIAPTKPLKAGLHAGTPPTAQQGGLWLRHTTLGWRGRTPWAAPADGGCHGTASSRNLASGMASGQPSTDPNSAGCPKAPGLRSPQHRTGATAVDLLRFIVASAKSLHPQAPARRSFRQGRREADCPLSAGWAPRRCRDVSKCPRRDPEDISGVRRGGRPQQAQSV